MIKAVVFDVDGTLLDTREYIAQAFEYALTKHGLPLPSREEIRAQVGPPLADCYRALAPGASIESLCEAHRAFQKEHYDVISTYPGTHELLQKLREKNIKIGLASTRSVTLIPSVEHAGIAPLVDCIVDGSAVKKNKPDPEALFVVLNSFSIAPKFSAMVGDTHVDIEAGKNAGVARTFGITHGFGTRESLVAAQADHVIDTLSELETLISL